METIADRIKKCRKECAMTQAQVTKALNMSASTYNRHEKDGDFKPDTLIKIAELFNVSVNYLLYGEEKTEELFPPEPQTKPKEPLRAESPNLTFDDFSYIISTITNDEAKMIKKIRTLSPDDYKFVKNFLETH